MLDIDVTINDLDTTQEIPAETRVKRVLPGRINKVALCVPGYVLYFHQLFFSFYIGNPVLNTFLHNQVIFKLISEALTFQLYLLIGYQPKYCIYYLQIIEKNS